MMSGSQYQRHQIEIDEVFHTFQLDGQPLPILKGVSLQIERGESCAILGSSGSGKSTLLNIIGLLDQAVSGSYWLNGHDVGKLTNSMRADLRNRLIGFVFQNFNLLPRLNALDNVALPLQYRGLSLQKSRLRAQHTMESVGLGDRLHHRPADLSGGQRQRVAIARALVGEPELILADEPTGNLDSESAQDIMSLLLGLNDLRAVTLVMVTHDLTIAKQLKRCLYVRDGHVTESRNLVGDI